MEKEYLDKGSQTTTTRRKQKEGRGRRGGQNHVDINCPTSLRVLSAAEAEEKWWPYSPPAFEPGYLPLCYDSKTPCRPVALSFR